MSRWFSQASDSSARGFGFVLGGLGASMVAREVTGGLGRLTDAPSVFHCPRCKCQIGVPDSAWAWPCLVPNCNSTNAREMTKCGRCGSGKPSLPPPEVRCPQCAHLARVPSTQLSAKLRALLPGSRGGRNDAPAAPLPVALPPPRKNNQPQQQQQGTSGPQRSQANPTQPQPTVAAAAAAAASSIVDEEPGAEGWTLLDADADAGRQVEGQ